MTGALRERLIPCESRAALDRVVAHAIRHLRPVRRWRFDDQPLVGVVCDRDFADVCRHVVACDDEAPARFEVVV